MLHLLLVGQKEPVFQHRAGRALGQRLLHCCLRARKRRCSEQPTGAAPTCTGQTGGGEAGGGAEQFLSQINYVPRLCRGLRGMSSSISTDLRTKCILVDLLVNKSWADKTDEASHGSTCQTQDRFHWQRRGGEVSKGLFQDSQSTARGGCLSPRAGWGTSPAGLAIAPRKANKRDQRKQPTNQPLPPAPHSPFGIMMPPTMVPNTTANVRALNRSGGMYPPAAKVPSFCWKRKGGRGRMSLAPAPEPRSS